MGYEYSTHFGAYGVAIQDSNLLCILKNSGPYKNRFDLPGGSQEIAEGLTETLIREVKEETGYEVLNYRNNRIYDAFVREENSSIVVHHIFVLYDVFVNEKDKKDIPLEVNDGKNDSDGIVWMPIEELNIYNSSPIVLKVLDEVHKEKYLLKKSNYLNWKVL